MKTLTKLFIFLSVFQVNSQIAGESTYEFLNISSSPRQLALGGKEITLFDFDVNQPSINPASLNSRMNNNLAINFSNYFSDIKYGTAAYAYTFNNRGNTMDKLIKMEYIGILFLAFGFGMMLGIIGFVEELQTIGYGETIEIATRIILSTFLMLIGVKIINGN